MEYIEEIINDLDQSAIEEIRKYGVPSLEDYNDNIQIALELGKKMNANLDVIKLASRFVDIKLGEAISQKKINEHLNMGLGFAKEFLGSYPLQEDIKNKVFRCIIEHNSKNFSCVESEICANADCYKFLIPRKILKMFYNLKQQGYNFEEIFILTEEKVDEKWNLLTLDICKKQLESDYLKIKEFLELSKKNTSSLFLDNYEN